MEKIGYVYLTTNLINGKMYVGHHFSEGFDKYYKGSGTYIMRAFKKYGWDNFKCEVLQWCSTQTQLNEVEDNCIRLYGTMVPNGYNLRWGGSNGRFSKESRKNVSNGHKKYFENEENRKKQSKVVKKCWENEEYRKKMSEAHKDKTPTEETRKKLSEASKKCWKNEEYRKKISEANKGKITSEETRKKQSEAAKKRYANEENRKKTSEVIKKCWKNEETRKKHSESSKKYWENEENRKKHSDVQRNDPKKSKKVFQYTLNGEFVKEWASVREINRVLGFDRNFISRCCNGKQKTAYKHLWSFEPLN